MPLVSVIIPAYNYATYLGQAIESVLAQSFSDFEIIVVDDGSTDNTQAVATAFTDERVRYIYRENGGLPAARNTGIRSAKGQLYAYLDADDTFHPDKLAQQVAFLEANPSVGLTYNSRVFVNAEGEPLFIQRAPTTVTLRDLLLSYPIAPSDVLMRREWAWKVGLFDESFRLNSEDLNFHLRLALAGCKMAGLARPLSFRRIHRQRRFGNIEGKMATYIRALDTAFEADDCPAGLHTLRNQAYATHYLAWAYQAAVQDDTALARTYFAKASELNPTLLANQAKPLLRSIVKNSVRDGEEPVERLEKVYDCFPAGFHTHPRHWSIGRAYALLGTQSTLWGRTQQGRQYLRFAQHNQVAWDNSLVNYLVESVFNLALLRDETSAEIAWQALGSQLKAKMPSSVFRSLQSKVHVNLGFKYFANQTYAKVTPAMLRAIYHQPRFLLNAGVWSTTLQSLRLWIAGGTAG